jgi:hypothetical protein
VQAVSTHHVKAAVPAATVTLADLPRSGNVLTHLVMAVLGAGLAADLLLALDIPARRFQLAIATDNAATDTIVFPFTIA